MQGFKIKSLVWENFDAWSYWAKSVVGTYRVREINGVWRTTLDCEGGDRVQPIYEYMTDDLTPLDFEAAQLAAQADYEARIMAALDVQPLTGQDAARVLLSDPDAVAKLARAYDREDSAQRGEADPHDGRLFPTDPEWEGERIACATAALRAIAEGRA